MRVYAVGAAVAVALVGPWAALASPAHGRHQHAGASKRAAAVCPVSGKTVADTKQAPKSVYKGKTYYFCCPECKPKFDKTPARYVKA
ncbi:MAG: YHS domain-containing protein [Armatimonadota bacterium]